MVYMTDAKALKLFQSCLNELYINSIPSITWDEVKEKYGNKPRSEFYLKHCIDEELYNNIVFDYKKKLTLFYRRQLPWLLLDYAPTICMEKDKK